MKDAEFDARLIKLWLEYQGSGTPYGNTFEGLMEWLKEKVIKQ